MDIPVCTEQPILSENSHSTELALFSSLEPSNDLCNIGTKASALKAYRIRHRIASITARSILIFTAVLVIAVQLTVFCTCITTDVLRAVSTRLLYGVALPDGKAPFIEPPISSKPFPLFPLLHLFDNGATPEENVPNVEDTPDLDENPSDDIIIPDGYYPIVSADLSVDAEFGLYASNETSYEIDLVSYLDRKPNTESVSSIVDRYGADAPVVLIVHTHGTEAYAKDGAKLYCSEDNCRTTDTTKNVVAVGNVIADYLNDNGINTIHCTEMFDAESYINAYSYASDAIKEFTAIYPSIEYVFDVHRDSVISSDMTKLRPVTNVDGTPTAQFMCVIGTDERAGTHVGWESNLTLACKLQASLWQRSNTLTRRMSIRSASYNQRYAPGSLLLEIGSCGNTLDEAKACARIVAEELAKIILDQ